METIFNYFRYLILISEVCVSMVWADLVPGLRMCQVFDSSLNPSRGFAAGKAFYLFYGDKGEIPKYRMHQT